MARTQTITLVTVNAAFLREIKEVHQDLWRQFAALRLQLQTIPRSAAECHPIVEAFAQLRDQLALHFALEEAFGYFEEPLYVAPRLAEWADSLRGQHKSLYSEISRLAESVDHWQHTSRLIASLPRLAIAFDNFYSRILEHEAAEQDLILQAYDDDLGCGD